MSSSRFQWDLNRAMKMTMLEVVGLNPGLVIIFIYFFKGGFQGFGGLSPFSSGLLPVVVGLNPALVNSGGWGQVFKSLILLQTVASHLT